MANEDRLEDKNKKQEDTTTELRVAAVKTAPPWPLITIGVFATVVIVAVVIGGWAFIASQRDDRATGRYGMMSQSLLRGDDGQMSRGGLHRGGGLSQQAVARGVITAINGDTITVSGLGKQTTVKRSSTTTVGGDKTDIAVNDTVSVYGTTNSDGSVTATRIVVNNQLNGGKAVIDDSGSNTGVPGV